MAAVPSNYVGSADPWGFDESTGASTTIIPRQVWTPFGESSHEHIWQDDASCNDADPTLFEIAQDGDPSVEWRNSAPPKKRVGLPKINMARYEQAKAICETCPVKDLCLSSADPADLYWTTRGGQMPGQLVAFLAGADGPRKGRRAPSFRYDDYNLWSCKKHGRESVGIKNNKADGKVYKVNFCRVCDSERAQAKRKV